MEKYKISYSIVIDCKAVDLKSAIKNAKTSLKKINDKNIRISKIEIEEAY